MHARALPSVPRHVPIWANFVVYGPILKISNSMCMSNGNLEFSDTAQLCSVLLEIAQLGSALLGRLPEATALEPDKLPLILSVYKYSKYRHICTLLNIPRYFFEYLYSHL